MYKKSLFIFRRDLRLEDNIGLIEALQNSTEVIPCFIYDENLIYIIHNILILMEKETNSEFIEKYLY